MDGKGAAMAGTPATSGKALPKTFGDALVKKLNRACRQGEGCGLSCSGIGWCPECWSAASRRGRAGGKEA